MFDVLKLGGFKVLHLIDGDLLPEAVSFVKRGKGEGINLNYIKNWTDLEPLRGCKAIKYLQVNNYPSSINYDYLAIHSLDNLLHLMVDTTDKKEIDFSALARHKECRIAMEAKSRFTISVRTIKSPFSCGYKGRRNTEYSHNAAGFRCLQPYLDIW